MNKEEAEALKGMIDSFVEEDVEAEVEVKVLNRDDVEKMFHDGVPEGWEDGYRAVRSPSTGDRVFLQIGDERRHVPDLETLQRLGLELADVVDLTDEELGGLKERFGLKSVTRWNE